MPGATLRLVETASGHAWVSWTDENGHFDLPGLPPGHYRAEVTQLGFDTSTQEFDLAAQTPSSITVNMKVATLEAIEQPVASSQQAPTPSANATAEANAPEKNTAPTSAAAGSGQAPTAPATSGRRGQGQGRPGGAQGGVGRFRQGANGARAGGFQQVNVNNAGANNAAGQEADQAAQEAEEEPAAPAAGSPLGQASSSDAFLMNGTVGQGDLSAAAGFAGPGGNPGPGGPGGPGGGPGFAGGPGGGPPGGPGGGPGGGPPPGAPGRGGRPPARGRAPQGVAALWGQQRVQRQRANRVRGSFYDQYSSSALDAKPFTIGDASAPKIPSWSEQIGGNLGGPLVIPHIYDGRDKTFFFVNYDSTWTRSAVNEISTVPTLAERGGDFTDRGVTLYCPSANPGGALGTAIQADCPSAGAILNPAQPGVIPGNIMAAEPSTITGLLNFIPAPTSGLTGLTNNFLLQTTVPTQTNRLNVRVLQTISPKLNARIIYAINAGDSHSFQNFPDFESNQSSRGQSVTLGLTQNLTSSWINDTQLIFTRQRTRNLNNFAFVNNAAADLGITGVSPAPIDWGVPQLGFTNYTGAGTAVPSLTRNQTYRFVDGVTNTRAKHTVTFGVDVRRMENNTDSDPDPNGQFTFGGLETALPGSTGLAMPNTGWDFADFLLDLPTATDLRTGTPSVYFRSWGFATYVSDDWRIRPDFSFQYGVRYELFTPYTELYNHISDIQLNSTFTEATVVCPLQTASCNAASSSALINTDHHNLAPRVGIAWRPPFKKLQDHHATTVRAGYSMLYNEGIYGQLAGELANQFPWANSERFTTATCQASSQTLTLQTGFPSACLSSSGISITNTYAVNPDYKVGYAQVWNLSSETALMDNTSLTVTYTGTKGTGLDMLFAFNRSGRSTPGTPYTVPDAGTFTYDTTGGNSIFHSLQVRLQHRMSHGMMFNTIYTYGKSIDDASSIGGGSSVVVQNPQDISAEYGLSSFDIRHQLRANYVYALPLGDGHRFAQKGLTSDLFGNWRFSGNIAAQTGTPFTAKVQGSSVANTGGGGAFASRADQSCDPNLPASERTVLHYFNTACFGTPTESCLDGTELCGTAGRNTIIGPGMFTWNAQLAKTIPFGRDRNRRVEVRLEITNLTNTPHFTGLSTVVGSSTFGQITSAGGNRTMDINTRVNF